MSNPTFSSSSKKPSKISFGKLSFPSINEEEKSKNESSGGFSTFSFEKALPKEEKNEEEEEMMKLMGFSSFDTRKKVTEKKAKVFDVKQMTEAIKKTKKKEKAERDLAEALRSNEIEVLEDEEVKVSEGSKTPERDIEGDGTPERNLSSDDDDEDDDEKILNAKDSDDDEEERGRREIPLTCSADFRHSYKAITALAIEPSGTRFATGSLDYEVKLWDFNGLKNKHAFRVFKPCESHVIRNLSYSHNGEALLVISGNCQAKVVDRDGVDIMECIKGDQYIIDMARTKGHVASLTGGQFNPKQKEIFLTCSEDGTCRLWDVNTRTREHTTCVKLRGLTGMKNPATACCFGRDGTMIFAGGRDGCINMWDTRRKLVVPTATIKSAHERNSDIFSIAVSNSGNFVASRGEDAVVNVWDTRNLTKALYKNGNFGAKYNTTDLIFSPDEKYILIPTLPPGLFGRDKSEIISHSELQFLRMRDFEIETPLTLTFQNEIITRVGWNYKINQLFFTFASGNFRITYDLLKSQKGALICHGMEPKRVRGRDRVEDLSNALIITPNALPLFKTDRPRNKKREEMKARLDPVKSKRPDLPISAGTAGRVGTSGSTLSSYVIRNLGMSKSVRDDSDPREAILKYAKEAEENPIWVTPAYQKTQPKAIFHDEDEEGPDSKKKRLL